MTFTARLYGYSTGVLASWWKRPPRCAVEVEFRVDFLWALRRVSNEIIAAGSLDLHDEVVGYLEGRNPWKPIYQSLLIRAADAARPALQWRSASLYDDGEILSRAERGRKWRKRKR